MEKDTNAHQPSATSGREPLPEHVLRTRREFVDLVAKIVADAIPSHRYDVVGIAERLGLSEQTFRRRLYICTGYTPKQFITSIQMREAERLLSEYPDAKVGCGIQVRLRRDKPVLEGIQEMERVRSVGIPQAKTDRGKRGLGAPA